MSKLAEQIAVLEEERDQYKMEVTRLKCLLESHEPDGRNVTNQQYIDLGSECDRLRRQRDELAAFVRKVQEGVRDDVCSPGMSDKAAELLSKLGLEATT